MPPEITALIDKPLSLIAVLFVGGIIGIFVEQVTTAQRRRTWRKRNGFLASKPKLVAPNDAADQLRTVMRADFTSRCVLNKSERRLFEAAERALAEAAPDWRVMAQVCLGEILASPDRAAFAAINSKRVDMLIMDAGSRPVYAIEYQGGGHHQGTAAARDAVKKEALRKAGVGYLEIVPGDTPSELRRIIVKITQAKAA